jgi:hypothetical protein
MEQINGTLDNIVLSCSLECRIKADIFPWSRSTWHFLQRSCLARACSKHAARQQFQLFSLNRTRASHLRMVIRLLFSLYRPTRIPFPVQYRHVEKANIIQDISETCSFRDCILTLRADPNTEQDFQSNISEGSKIIENRNAVRQVSIAVSLSASCFYASFWCECVCGLRRLVRARMRAEKSSQPCARTPWFRVCTCDRPWAPGSSVPRRLFLGDGQKQPQPRCFGAGDAARMKPQRFGSEHIFFAVSFAGSHLCSNEDCCMKHERKSQKLEIIHTQCS